MTDLILPPAAPGSLGDEAMLVATLQSLRARGVDRAGILEYSDTATWTAALEGYRTGVQLSGIDMSDYLGRGRREATESFSRALDEARALWFIAADVLDGFYSERETLDRLALITMATDAGVAVTVFSFSLNEHPTPAAAAALRALPPAASIVPRDPVTSARLASHAGRHASAGAGADVAFLLEPCEDTAAVKSCARWIAEARADRGGPVLGLNMNLWVNPDAAGASTPSDAGIHVLTRLYRQTMIDLLAADAGTAFVLLPHDTRGPVSDSELLDVLLESLPDKARERCHTVPASIRPGEAKAICRELDACLTGRMHLAIACLGSGVPAVCLPYQGKFDGLLAHFGLERLALPLDKALGEGTMHDRVAAVLSAGTALSAQIRRALPAVNARAAAPFATASPARAC